MNIPHINVVKKLYKRGFFHIFGTNVINKLLMFLNSVILVRVLTKPEYGIFAYVWNIYSLVMVVNGLGMDSAVLQLCCERIKDKYFCEQVVQQGARIGGIFNLILGVILLIIGMIVPLNFDKAHQLFYFLVLLPIAQFAYAMLCIILRIQQRNRGYAQMSLVYTFVYVFMGILLAVAFREIGLIAGYYLACLIGIIWGYTRLNIRVDFLKERLNKKDNKTLLYMGCISAFNNGISQLLHVLDIFVLGYFIRDEGILAGYKVATLLPLGLLFIPGSLIVYIFPYFAAHRNDGEWCFSYYKKIFFAFAFFNMVLSVGLFLSAEIWVNLMFGYTYIDVVPIAKIMIVDYFFSATFRTLAGNLLVSQRKLKFNSLVAIISGALNIILDVCFIKWWGATGAAIATLSITFISGVINTSYLIHIFKTTNDI